MRRLAVLACVVVLAGCGGKAAAKPDLGACEKAMRGQMATALANPGGTPAARPPACAGVSDADLQAIASRVLETTP